MGALGREPGYGGGESGGGGETPSVFLPLCTYVDYSEIKDEGFPGGAVVKNPPAGASLAAQWLRVCLPMQGTWVRALVWEDPTCRGATRPVSHNY